MSKILALDPGHIKTAWVMYDDAQRRIDGFNHVSNNELLLLLREGFFKADHLAVEMIASYGMAVGKEVFETCVWIGRLIEAWETTSGAGVQFIYRAKVKSALCKTQKATDGNIRQRLIDILGPPGTKKAPGPTYGFSGDMWQALAVAVVAAGDADELAGLPDAGAASP